MITLSYSLWQTISPSEWREQMPWDFVQFIPITLTLVLKISCLPIVETDTSRLCFRMLMNYSQVTIRLFTYVIEARIIDVDVLESHHHFVVHHPLYYYYHINVPSPLSLLTTLKLGCITWNITTFSWKRYKYLITSWLVYCIPPRVAKK